MNDQNKSTPEETQKSQDQETNRDPIVEAISEAEEAAKKADAIADPPPVVQTSPGVTKIVP